MTMKWFVCSMANAGRKKVVALLTDDVGHLEKFAADHDRPGRAVYACINPLRDDATAREKSQVAAIITLHVDIDYKRLATPPAEVKEKVLALARALPLEVRETGGGLHVLANLKEPYENGTEHYRRAEGLRSRLTHLLCGDPAPNHSAALMRCVGSHNTKYAGEPFEVRVISAGEPVDLTDVETIFDYHAEPLFELREEFKPGDNVVTLDIPHSPLDLEAVLADMPTTGEGVNAVQWRLMWGLVVRDGRPPDEALSLVIDATMAMAEREGLHDVDGVLWTREAEVRAATPRMNWVLRCLQTQHWKAVEAGHIGNDALPDWLPAEWHESWVAGCRKGGKPVVHRNSGGYCIRVTGVKDGAARPPHDEEPQRNGSDTPSEKKYRFRLISFQDMKPGLERRTSSTSLSPPPASS